MKIAPCPSDFKLVQSGCPAWASWQPGEVASFSAAVVFWGRIFQALWWFWFQSIRKIRVQSRKMRLETNASWFLLTTAVPRCADFPDAGCAFARISGYLPCVAKRWVLRCQQQTSHFQARPRGFCIPAFPPKAPDGKRSPHRPGQMPCRSCPLWQSDRCGGYNFQNPGADRN